MAFLYTRTVRFQETDAAGVVFFANTLTACHEAYEASLMAAGVDVRLLFGGAAAGGRAIALPIVHAEADYLRPAHCGDRHEIELTPTLQSEHAFVIEYVTFEGEHRDKPVSRALTRHFCIETKSRQRHPLPSDILDWINQWR